MLIVLGAICLIFIFLCSFLIIQHLRNSGAKIAISKIIGSGIMAVFIAGIVLIVSNSEHFEKEPIEFQAPSQASSETVIHNQERAEQNLEADQSKTDVNELDGSDVSGDAEIILMQIAEDIAKQVAKNPSTVKFKTLYWGFWRNERIYAVEGTFICSNLMGAQEENVLRVVCEASEDYKKIVPYEVSLNGKLIA